MKNEIKYTLLQEIKKIHKSLTEIEIKGQYAPQIGYALFALEGISKVIQDEPLDNTDKTDTNDNNIQKDE